jgi:hypothetical protein
MSLDDDIAAWAATVRLPDAEADAIFRRIVSTPPAASAITPRLDPTWWQHYSAGFAERMVASTRPARPARRAA